MTVPGGPSDLPQQLPHGDVARLVERIVERGADEITCEGTVPPASPFAEGAHAPSFLALELAAQAAALLELAGATARGERWAKRIGYLVRVRAARFATAVVPVGRPLTVRVRRTRSAPPLFRYEAEVADADGATVFEGSFGTFVESD